MSALGATLMTFVGINVVLFLLGAVVLSSMSGALDARPMNFYLDAWLVGSMLVCILLSLLTLLANMILLLRPTVGLGISDPDVSNGGLFLIARMMKRER